MVQAPWPEQLFRSCTGGGRKGRDGQAGWKRRVLMSGAEGEGPRAGRGSRQGVRYEQAPAAGGRCSKAVGLAGQARSHPAGGQTRPAMALRTRGSRFGANIRCRPPRSCRCGSCPPGTGCSTRAGRWARRRPTWSSCGAQGQRAMRLSQAHARHARTHHARITHAASKQHVQERTPQPPGSGVRGRASGEWWEGPPAHVAMRCADAPPLREAPQQLVRLHAPAVLGVGQHAVAAPGRGGGGTLCA